MKRKKNILVLGYFGFITNQLDGQTVKTRNIYELLKLKENELGTVNFFDTQKFQTNLLSFLSMFVRVIMSTELIYIPAHNNLKYIFPILFLACLIFKTKIFYIVVGGWLVEYLHNKPLHKALLKNIECILPQTSEIRTELNEKYGFKNVKVLPNYRIHKYKPEIRNSDDNFRIVFMARINYMKGIDTVFNIANFFQNNKMGTKTVSIDFYGPIHKNDEVKFLKNIEKYSNTSYIGQLFPDKIHNTLSQYDVMVLPTKYFTEGFPGSILDAYISGIPVIVTKWKHATEFVEDNQTGFIVPFDNGEEMMIQKLLELYNNPMILLKMKRNAYSKSKQYSSDYAWKIIISEISRY